MESRAQPEKTPSQLEEGNKPPLYDNPQDAFKAFLEETVLSAVSQTYQPPMSVAKASLDMFQTEGKLDPKKIAMKVASLAIGISAALFYAIPAQNAGYAILQLINQYTGYSLPAGEILPYLMEYTAAGENVFVNTLASNEMLNHYLLKNSPAYDYLTNHEATRREKLENYGRNVLNLASAIAAATPNYFLIQSTSIPIAVVTATANVSLNWMGVSLLQLAPDHTHPARRVEIEYLRDQIKTFLKLPFEKQNEILDELADIEKNSIHDDTHFRKIYARMLNIAKPVTDEQTSTVTQVTTTVIQVQEYHSISAKQRIVPRITAAAGCASEVSFAGAAYIGVSQLFANTTSPQAYAAAVPSALLALLTAFGLGGGGGYQAGKDLVSDDVELAQLYNSKVRPILRFLIKAFSAFSGGATFGTAYSVTTTLCEALNISDPATSILALAHAIFGHTGISVINSYYVSKLLDEILVEFALRCGDEKIKRLFKFVEEMRNVQGLLERMSEENYLELLKWKLSIPHIPNDNDDKQEVVPGKKDRHKHEKPYRELSHLLMSVFDSRMSDKEYIKTQSSLKKLNFKLKDRTLLPHYQLIPSFFVDEAKKVSDKNPSLRRRKCCGLFSRNSYDFEDSSSDMQTKKAGNQNV